jgi:hypothetical protein
MKLVIKYCVSILLLLYGRIAISQTTVVTNAAPVKGTTVVIAGKDYARSRYHNFFWGSHYRKEWNTPVRVRNFYLDTAKGGLIATETGGGRETRSLRVKDKEGKEYVLRSVHKRVGQDLPDEARGTFISRIARDQGSVDHPFAAIVIPPLAEAAGIYHTIPIIVFVPEQAGLGSFNKEYGNQLYLFEERPDENQEGSAHFGNSVNLIGSDKLFEHIWEDNDNHVDEKTFVRARLFDMVIGDWGRHPGNWRWAKFDVGKSNIYRPVPRDRDHAFTKIDGLYPSLAGSIYKPFQGFDKTIKDVPGWDKHGRPLDRLFLTDLTKDEWITQAKQIQQALTDTLISSSVRLMPPELFVISGNSIIERIKSRRDHLQEYAAEYYKYLSQRADLAGTHDRELFTIDRINRKETKIEAFKITKEGEVKKDPFYSRLYNSRETREVRIYSLESNDKVIVRGTNSRNPIKIRVIDPDATDSVLFEGDHLQNEVVIYQGDRYEYDTAHQKKFNFSIRPFISSSRYQVFDRNPLKSFPRTGLKVIATLTYIPKPWEKAEYETSHHLCFNYGILRNAFNFGYIGRWGRLFGNWDFVIKARMDAPAVENFFGTGNESKLINKTRNYYRTQSERQYVGIGIERNIEKVHHFEFSLIAQSIKINSTGDHYITAVQTLVDPSVFDRKFFAGVEAGYSYLNVDNQVFPFKGVGVSLGAGYIRNIDDNKSFVKGLLSTTAFLPLSRQFSLAIRAGGGALSGTADYYNLNSIGGGGSGEMRGYDRERFYGKQSFYLNNDLRWVFNTKNYLYNGKAGLLVFYDMGRVWMPGEISHSLHGSYGFGAIFIPYNRFSLTATYGISSEATHINFKTGFFF